MVSKNPDVTHMMILLWGDLLIGVGAFYSGILLRVWNFHAELLLYKHLFMRIAFFSVVLLFCSFFTGLYDQERHAGKRQIVLTSAIAGLISFVVLSAFYFLLPLTAIWRSILVIAIMIFVLTQILWHITLEFFLRHPSLAKRVLILGAGQKAENIGKLIGATNHNYILSGYIPCSHESVCVPALQVIGDENSILDVAQKKNIQKIVISLSERRGVLPLKEIMKCKMNGVDVLDGSSFYEQVAGKLLIEDISPSWFIYSDGFKITTLKMSIKRTLDVILSVVGIFITLPLFPIIAMLIKIDSPGRVFFRQVRVGEKEKKFVLYKFRTMREDAEKETGAVWAQEVDLRVTRVGRFLRKARLDEIPQLYNVLKGDMSFVGPRPERPEFVEKLKETIPYYSERHIIRGGITGWAQVKYPYGASVGDAIEKLRYDLYYIKNLSLFLDMLIVFETCKVVLFGRGSR
jgi:sugar transferase (PEP-CTERM system associated)